MSCDMVGLQVERVRVERWGESQLALGRTWRGAGACQVHVCQSLFHEGICVQGPHKPCCDHACACCLCWVQSLLMEQAVLLVSFHIF